MVIAIAALINIETDRIIARKFPALIRVIAKAKLATLNLICASVRMAILDVLDAAITCGRFFKAKAFKISPLKTIRPAVGLAFKDGRKLCFR